MSHKPDSLQPPAGSTQPRAEPYNKGSITTPQKNCDPATHHETCLTSTDQFTQLKSQRSEDDNTLL